jgi:hypothetical protein
VRLGAFKVWEIACAGRRRGTRWPAEVELLIASILAHEA